jgi:hypothetical protein
MADCSSSKPKATFVASELDAFTNDEEKIEQV